MSGRQALFLAYVVVCALALTWPGYSLLGVGAPVLGLPRPFAYNVGWVLLTFLVLVAFHLTGRDTEGEADE